MKIVYLSTCINPKYFFQGDKPDKKALNPSGQNFHWNLMHALKEIVPVEAISIPPLSPYLTNKKEIEAHEEKNDDITFHYVRVSYSKTYKFFKLRKNIRKTIKKIIEPDDIIIFDGLNRPATFAVTNYFRKNKKVMLLTDDPSNLTYGGKRYARSLKNKYLYVRNVIALTDNLLKLVPFAKRKLVIEGVMSNNPYIYEPNQYSPYIFLGGALFHRYGVDTLVNAFLELNHPNLNLVIAGQGDLVNNLRAYSTKYHHIHFLGLINHDESLKLEAGALFNVNPRPLFDNVDKSSVPSKVIECASANRPLITTKSPIISQIFQNHLYYFEGDDVISIKNGLEKLVNTNENELENKGKELKKAVESRLSPHKIAIKILDFLRQ